MKYLPFVSMVFFAVAAAAGDPVDVLGDGRDEDRALFLELVNRERAEQGLEPLRLVAALSRAAQTHADDMAEANYVAFTSPGGLEIEDWVRGEGYRAHLVTEKIALTGTRIPDLVESWGDAPENNRASLFHPEVRDLGIGIATQKDVPLYALALALSENDFWGALTAPLKDLDRTRQAMLERVNELRAEQKARELKRSPVLDRVAQAHAKALLGESLEGNSRKRGADVIRRLREEGYSYRRAGENVILGPFSVEEALGAALDEETHRKNLLGKAYRETGLGVAVSEESGSKTVVWVHYFALPRVPQRL